MTALAPAAAVSNAIRARWCTGPWRNVGLVLQRGMTWAGAGIGLGLLGAWSASRAVTSLLFDVSAADPLTFAVAALALAAVAALACMVPAIRATRIDPVMARRGD
jgi:ABC-type antimicrobial peptide transport system permease subunit